LDAADRWKGLSAAAIIAKLQTWLEVVEQATGKTPVIYTQPRWWNNRIGKTDKLAKYQIWIADYSTKSQLSEVPQTPAGYPVHLWQFSENGRADGTDRIDVNVFGSRDEFLTACRPKVAGLMERKFAFVRSMLSQPSSVKRLPPQWQTNSIVRAGWR
jgi:GH25 family lysozyme M1 (1,4-beta-N-acetylmuramidase)